MWSLENKVKNFFNGKSVLELGSNTGLVSKQILKLTNNLTLLDNKKKFIDILIKDRTFKKCSVKKVNFFNTSEMSNLKNFDLIYLREIFNFLSIRQKNKLIKILKKKLNKKGVIIITDFYGKVFYRKILLNIFKFKINYKDLIKKKNKYHFSTKKNLKEFSKEHNLRLKIYDTDLFNNHVPLIVKVFEKIFPCKFTIILFRQT